MSPVDPNPTFTTSPVGDRGGWSWPFASGSLLWGNRRLGQFVEQRLGLLQVGGVEAFGEPAEDGGEEGDRLLRPALLPAQAGEAHRGAQFPGLRVLPAGAAAGLSGG